MIVQSEDGFSRKWFDSMADSFISKYTPGFMVSGYDVKHLCFSTFQVHLIYVSENGTNTALVIYEKGGHETGITGQEFYKMYK